MTYSAWKYQWHQWFRRSDQSRSSHFRWIGIYLMPWENPGRSGIINPCLHLEIEGSILSLIHETTRPSWQPTTVYHIKGITYWSQKHMSVLSVQFCGICGTDFLSQHHNFQLPPSIAEVHRPRLTWCSLFHPFTFTFFQCYFRAWSNAFLSHIHYILYIKTN